MTTVTERIKEIKQPRGGYLPLRNFTVTDMDEIGEVTSPENIRANLVGIAVDYLTRFTTYGDSVSAFEISLHGAHLIQDETTALNLLRHLDGLTDDSIRAACQLVGYDVVYRADPSRYKPVQDINPNQNTINNIRKMVQRMINFLESNPPVMEGFDFTGGYTDTVHIGDDDILTENELWDIKVSRYMPNSKNTLQILMYWLMGCRSVHPQFQSVSNLGIVNPRPGKTWTIKTSAIPKDIIKQVSTDVIGYKA